MGRDSAAVAAGCGDVWDSGRTDSDGMLVRYAGPKLDPFTRYYWAVTVWDKDYARSSSGVAAFETGMMGAGNWQGCWISDHHDINHKPAPYFRKEFSVGKRVKSARAYVAAAGLYELHINGRKVGDHRLDPMYTRFDRRNLYVTYDVTRQLQDGAMPWASCWATAGTTTSRAPCGTSSGRRGATARRSASTCVSSMRTGRTRS